MSYCIVIGAKGPTDILLALASTVSQDFTAPLYKYHDDPYLIPASNTAKRTYALSKESGKKAARWIFNQYPSYFNTNPAEPVVEAFMHQPVFDENSEVTEDILKRCITEVQVSQAILVYNKLKSKGISISRETEQSLLEFLCFTNCQDEPDPEYIEERWFKQMVSKDRKRMWKEKNAAEKLFESIQNKDASMYCAMICGLAKYLHVERAWELYQDMQSSQLPMNIDAYNALLRVVPFLREIPELRWELSKQLLQNISQQRLLPNLGTLNAVLESLSKLGSWRTSQHLSLQMLAEMNRIGIKPSLASYYYLLVIFCREKGPISTILLDIMDQLDGKEFVIQDPKDVFFFVTAMDICHSHLQDKDLAYRVHNLLTHGNNYILIGDSMKESIYYQHFFKIICSTENIDTFFEVYNKLVPNVYTPEPSVMLEILQSIELNAAYHYIPQIWSDMLVFDHLTRERLVEALLKLLTVGSKNSELGEKFAKIAWDIKTHVDNISEDMLKPKIQWTGMMLGNALLTCLHGGEFEHAWELMTRLINDQHKISGVPDVEVISVLMTACMNIGDATKAIACLDYTTDVGYSEASELGQKLLANMELSKSQRGKVQDILGGKLSNAAEESDA